MNHLPDEVNPSQPKEDLNNDESNWIDEETTSVVSSQTKKAVSLPEKKSSLKAKSTLIMVETAFLASTSSLIWLINYYFPLGPLLRIFFPIPIALAYLRWGNRAAWMTALVSGLLLSVLMGPTRSIIFLIPYGIMGVQLGYCWRRNANWGFSLLTGAIIGVFGFFFQVWLFSILLGEDLWLYVINQITELVQWIFMQLSIISQPNFGLIQSLAIIMIFINNLLYLFTVHLVALLVLDRLGNRIPRPPEWVKVILDYE